MSKKHNGVNHSMTVKAQSRRKKVITRLENQLASKHKMFTYTDAEGSSKTMRIPLLDKDIARINLEIEVLKKRV
jgi:hypothetical protein